MKKVPFWKWLILWGWMFYILLFLTSCSSSFFCSRCFESAKIKYDTLRISDTLRVASVQIDTVFNSELSTDTLAITKDRLTIKYRDVPGPTIYIAGECDSIEKIVEKRVRITTKISTGYTIWHIILACLAGAGVVALLFLLRR